MPSDETPFETDLTSALGDIRISVIGLGYVGLPVAVHMADVFPTLGFDIDEKRVSELKKQEDHTKEVLPAALANKNLQFTNQADQLKSCNFHIVAVPTPVNDKKEPDLTSLKAATKTVGQILKKGDTVVFESTVFPGATEEVCLPILTANSGLTSSDFYLGYSPERINPGDKEHSFAKIVKVVSAMTSQGLDIIAAVYGKVVKAGIFKAESIKVAEAAKVIENTQRDINIAFMNELALICEKMHIDTYSVLEAAKTKWNFLDFKPGLVGGHCIGVDPYYLTHKAEQLGYKPEVILSGRRINDDMPKRLAERLIKKLENNHQDIKGLNVNVLGLTFKENCPDLRNTKVVDMISALKNAGLMVSISDPCASNEEAQRNYGLELTTLSSLPEAAATVVAVKHKEFMDMDCDQIKSPLIFDIKGIFATYNGSKEILSL